MKKTILGLLAVVVIWGGYTAYDYFTGAEIGGPCQYNGDCKGTIYGKFGNQCLGLEGGAGICTMTCSTSADCQAPMTCQEFEYTENGIAKGTNKVCAPPDPSQPVAPGAPPAALPPGAVPLVPAPVPVPAQ